MKKLFIILALWSLLVLPTWAFAVDYYAQDGSGDMSTREWDTTPTGGGTDLVWANRAAGDVFYANGQTAIAIDADPGANGTVTLSTAAGAGTAGGGFTYATATNIDITANLIAGTTNCVDATGSSGKLNIIGTFQGGTSSSRVGLSSSHTVITATTTGNATGGAGSGAYGIITSGTGPTTHTGDCTGNDSSNSVGCMATGSGAITVTGSIVAKNRSLGVGGSIIWAPSSAQKYIAMDGSGTVIYASAGLGSDAGGTQITGANTSAQVATGTYFVKKDDGVYTQGSASAGAGGGGAWGF